MPTTEFCLPITTPLSQQELLPYDLPKDWDAQSLLEQTAFLQNNAPLISVDTFVSAGLEVGAQHLDRVAEASGGIAVHQAILAQELGTPAVIETFTRGKTEYQTRDDLPSNATATRISYGNIVAAVEILEASFGATVVNTSILVDAMGRTVGTKKSNPANVPIGTAVLNAMEHAEWDMDLQGIGALLALYQTAGRRARGYVRPLLTGDTRTLPGKEAHFWHTKLAGTEAQDNKGIAYYFGYRSRSGPILRDAMQERWKSAYPYNRSVFTAACNINLHGLSSPQRDKVQKEVRKPAFTSIGQGDFTAAYGVLQEAAASQPNLFALPSLKFLQKDD